MGNPPSQAGELLRCFFAECERHFRFLEERFGYSFLHGLIEYQRNYKLIKPVPKNMHIENFQGVARYERDDKALEILYGGEQFRIEGYVYYDPVQRFEFDDIMLAARKRVPKLHGDWGVTSPEIIHETIAGMASATQKYANALLNPNPKVLERAMSMRSSLIEQSVRQHHASFLQHVSEDAALAFRERDYRRVVELLKPHEKYLKRAEAKKLQQAQERLFSDSSQS